MASFCSENQGDLRLIRSPLADATNTDVKHAGSGYCSTGTKSFADKENLTPEAQERIKALEKENESLKAELVRVGQNCERWKEWADEQQLRELALQTEHFEQMKQVRQAVTRQFEEARLCFLDENRQLEADLKLARQTLDAASEKNKEQGRGLEEQCRGLEEKCVGLEEKCRQLKARAAEAEADALRTAADSSVAQDEFADERQRFEDELKKIQAEREEAIRERDQLLQSSYEHLRERDQLLQSSYEHLDFAACEYDPDIWEETV